MKLCYDDERFEAIREVFCNNMSEVIGDITKATHVVTGIAYAEVMERQLSPLAIVSAAIESLNAKWVAEWTFASHDDPPEVKRCCTPRDFLRIKLPPGKTLDVAIAPWTEYPENSGQCILIPNLSKFKRPIVLSREPKHSWINNQLSMMFVDNVVGFAAALEYKKFNAVESEIEIHQSLIETADLVIVVVRLDASALRQILMGAHVAMSCDSAELVIVPEMEQRDIELLMSSIEEPELGVEKFKKLPGDAESSVVAWPSEPEYHMAMDADGAMILVDKDGNPHPGVQLDLPAGYVSQPMAPRVCEVMPAPEDDQF